MNSTTKNIPTDPKNCLTDWVPVGLTNHIPRGAVVRACLDQFDTAIWRGEDGVVRAWENRCPHRGMRLSYGFVQGNRLTCLYHGWTFGGDGICHMIPAHPDFTPPETIHTQTYQTCETGGLIWVALAAMPVPAPVIKGTWTPCRSLHFGQQITLAALLADSGLSSTPLTKYAICATRKDQTRIVLAIQLMGEHGMMVHCSIASSDHGSALHDTSRWLMARRAKIEGTVQE